MNSVFVFSYSGIIYIFGSASNAPILFINSTDYRIAYLTEFKIIKSFFKRIFNNSVNPTPTNPLVNISNVNQLPPLIISHEFIGNNKILTVNLSNISVIVTDYDNLIALNIVRPRRLLKFFFNKIDQNLKIIIECSEKDAGLKLLLNEKESLYESDLFDYRVCIKDEYLMTIVTNNQNKIKLPFICDEAIYEKLENNYFISLNFVEEMSGKLNHSINCNLYKIENKVINNEENVGNLIMNNPDENVGKMIINNISDERNKISSQQNNQINKPQILKNSQQAIKNSNKFGNHFEGEPSNLAHHTNNLSNIKQNNVINLPKEDDTKRSLLLQNLRSLWALASKKLDNDWFVARIERNRKEKGISENYFKNLIVMFSH
uniref:Hira domain-containing protein n=1 Tax=Meloidogyne hapla TaxID=6305 RepID=A0A1I8B6S5_MELHA